MSNLPPAPLPPYKRASAAVSNSRLGLSYNDIGGGSRHSYPGLNSAVVNLSGAPFAKPYFDSLWQQAQTHAGKRERLPFFIDYLSGLPSTPAAVVFSGGEPLMQTNSVLQLCRLLKSSFPSCAIKLDTTGYYAEALSELGRTVDYICLEVLAPLSAEAYAEATNYSHSPDILYSAVEKAFAFMNRLPCFKEIRVPVADGVNDCPDCLATIAAETSFADLLVLRAVEAKDGSAWGAQQVVDHARVACRFAERVAVEANGVRKRLK